MHPSLNYSGFLTYTEILVYVNISGTVVWVYHQLLVVSYLDTVG